MTPTTNHLRTLFSFESGVFRNLKDQEIAGCLHAASGYWQVPLKDTWYYAQDLAWLWYYHELPSAKLTHIDGDFLNNRIENLLLKPGKLRVGDRFGILTITEIDKGRFLHKCECGDIANVDWTDTRWKDSLRLHACCLGMGLPPHSRPPLGWGIDTSSPRSRQNDIFRTWKDFPTKGKGRYHDLMSTYSGFHEGRPLPPPCRIALRDPSKPATFENIEVFHLDDVGCERSFDGFQLSRRISTPQIP